MNAHVVLFARYNTLANARVYEACARLPPGELLKWRAASFGSIFALLNHMLVSDRIWMARFRGAEAASTGLDKQLYNTLEALRDARVAEDARIEAFMTDVDEAFLQGGTRYVNNQGRMYEDPNILALAHFFNHQTHHRGQIHALLSEAGCEALSLDMHRLLNP